MDRPAKRQKLSSGASDQERHPPTTSIPDNLLALSRPTRTLDLADFQRPYLAIQPAQQEKPKPKRRAPGRIVLPRAPDVTVTAGVLEVAVNDGSTATQIAVPTTAVAVTLSSLGTLTVPALTVSSSAPSSSSRSGSSSPPSSASAESSHTSNSASSSHSIISTATRNNSTLLSTAFSSDRTVTITATSTFHVSYNNGTFIAPTSTRHSSLSESSGLNDPGNNDEESTSMSGTYKFGQDMTSTFDATSASATGGSDHQGVDATATAGPGADPTSSPASGNGGGSSGSGGPILTPQQTQMVGGIVGGIAGMALIAIVLIYVLRWYKQRLKANAGLKDQINFDPAHDHGSSGLVGAAAPMSQSSRSMFSPSAGALVTTSKKWRRGSDMTAFTASTTESEKGFHRVSGRKIPSVLSTGGDQFGGSYGAFDEKVGMAVSSYPIPISHASQGHNHDLSESSFYHDSEGVYIGNGRPTSRSAPTTPIYGVMFHNQAADRPRRPSLKHEHSYQMDNLTRAITSDAGMGRPDGFAVIRNSPARTPMTQSPNTSSIALPVHTPVMMDGDVPEMPLSPTGYGLGLGHELIAKRIPSRMSARSEGSSGRFKEELA